ncbi:MAG: AMP-binding protein, partial [Gammaproteobacteria bacterium]|nr:AMP-binding protein [Gammaproteobacteria bacterium]MCP4089252.1 AMP-binding protein [Gammaproteobacteria bacterium]MCP4275324.1 AMP-binding protein [Gammaproteobacteria bacterium]
MKPVWLESYPPGIPRELDIDPDETLLDMFDSSVTVWADRPAFHNMGHTLSFADIDQLSVQFAAYLQNELKLKQGDRVAIMMPNLLQYPVALFGVLRAGMVAVNVNPLYTTHELEYQLQDSGAKAIVIYSGSAHVLAEIIANTDIEHSLITDVGDLLPVGKRLLVNFFIRFVKRLIPEYSLPQALSFRVILDAQVSSYQRPQKLTGSDLAILQYTGGTTGLSKGAMLSHTNLRANISQVNSWFGANDAAGEEIVLTSLPLYHVYALTVNCFAFFEKGGLNILITDPRDTVGLIKEMSRWSLTAMTGVNTLFQSLLHHPDFAKLDFSSWKVVSAGGMAVQESTAREWVSITGLQVIEGYGLSETSPVVSSNPINLKEFNGSIGLPLPATEVQIRDDNKQEVPVGEPGEIYVRGPQVMLGYWQKPEATADVLGSDGFLQTGDLATIDEQGYLRIVDRKKDMIIVSGFKVFPNDVENIVTGHPDIREAACIGVPDDDSGEIVKLFVVLRPGA